MFSTIFVTEKAPTVSLLDLSEAKVGLKVAAADTSNDDLLEMIIETCSDAVAKLCNRVLVKEQVIETFREVGSSSSIFLSRFPVVKINSINVDDTPWVVSDDYDLDALSGRLVALDNAWSSPVVVEYSGGYSPPQDVDPALKQAVLLFAREAYFASLRGDSSVRMIAHKESRIIYFDPTAGKGGGGGAGNVAVAGSATMKAAKDLLSKYTRYNI